MLETALPGVAAGARRARERKEIGAAGDPGRRPALDRRGADLLIAEPAEQLAEAGNLLLIDAVKGLGRDVPPGDADAAGRYHDADLRISDPCPQLRGGLGGAGGRARLRVCAPARAAGRRDGTSAMSARPVEAGLRLARFTRRVKGQLRVPPATGGHRLMRLIEGQLRG